MSVSETARTDLERVESLTAVVRNSNNASSDRQAALCKLRTLEKLYDLTPLTI